MGLDMYLNRVARYEGVTPNDVETIENYIDWLKSKEEGGEGANCTLHEWCGLDEANLPPAEVIDFYKNQFTMRHMAWDVRHEFGWEHLSENVGYWRKANQIHNWFVQNVQGGKDECEPHEVSRSQLESLLSACRRVLNGCELVDGEVCNGWMSKGGKMVPVMENGKVIRDPSVAEELLPTRDGFFFGGTGYNEYYLEDISYTVELLERVLEETDFDKQMVYYRSSW